MGAEAAGYLNSKWFLISIMGGYVFLILGIMMDEPMLIIGLFVSIAFSIFAYFVDYLNGVNQLAGSKTIDSITYTLGLKPQTKKLHVAFIDPIPLDLKKLKATESLDYEKHQADQMEIIKESIAIVQNSWKSSADILKDIKLNKESNISQVLKNELAEYDPLQKIFAYRCILIKEISFKGDDITVKFNQIVLITKRPWGLEFFSHQDDVIYNNLQLNADLCYAMLIRWGMATADMPIMYSKFTDIDAFEEARQAVDVKDILNIQNRVLDGLLTSQRAKYMTVDKKMEEQEKKINELKNNNEDLQQLLKIASAAPFRTKSDLLKNNQMKISKSAFGFMLFIIIVLIGCVAFLAAATFDLGPVDPGALTTTTTSTIP